MKRRSSAIWGLAGVTLIALPQVFSSGGSITLMSLMGIAVVLALSYNMLLGQAGMLSFGHAVYYGLGGFATAHTINGLAQLGWAVPLPLLPLAGGLAGLLFAALFGWVSTQRAGTAFAMISLGIGELVGACSLILRGFFGGEGGISTSRTALPPWFGLTFGPQVQTYYLIAGWCLLCAAAMYAFSRTPLGRIANAVRDNPERVAFIGYSTHFVRFLVFCIAGFFAGVAGGLAAIHFEIVTTGVLGINQSGQVLLMAFVGGTTFFVGPVVGAVLMTLLQISLSDYTGAWLVYVGLLFIAMVMFAPRGLAGLVLMHRPLWAAGLLGRLWPVYARAMPAAALIGVGVISLVELSQHALVLGASAPVKVWLGLAIDTRSPPTWFAVFGLLAVAAWLLNEVAPKVVAAFHEASREATQRGFG